MAGRPTKFTEVMRKKIDEAAALGCSDTEIALFCDISRVTYYAWLKEHPELVNRIEELRDRPMLKARKTIVDKLDESYSNAMDYAKRKRPKEFGDQVNVDVEAHLKVDL